MIPKYNSPKPAAGLVLVCSCVGAGLPLPCSLRDFMP